MLIRAFLHAIRMEHAEAKFMGSCGRARESDAIRMEHAEAKRSAITPNTSLTDAIRMEHAEAKAISRYHAATSGECNPYAARRGKVSPLF